MTNMIGVSGGSPIVSGTWQNPNTGDVIVVRDQSFGGDGMMYINTNDGRVLSFDQFSQYLQISDVELSAEEIRSIQGKPMISDQPLAPTPSSNNVLLDGLLPEDAEMIKRSINGENIYNHGNVTPQNPTISSNYQIIEKAFKDKVDAPNVELDWNVFPLKQITLLTEIMDIPMEDIAEYIYTAYINNKNVMIDKIKESIENRIHDIAANP